MVTLMPRHVNCIASASVLLLVSFGEDIGIHNDEKGVYNLPIPMKKRVAKFGGCPYNTCGGRSFVLGLCVP